MADPQLDLLLVEDEEHRPALAGGIDPAAAEGAPVKRNKDAFVRRRRIESIDSLRAQQWGVIAPKGRAGDAMLEAIEPLVHLREQEQGAPAKRYRVEPDLDARLSRQWWQEVYNVGAEEEQPLYLLMLGDLDAMSLELQQVLANNGPFVGRLAFGAPAGYAAYADKVQAFTRKATGEQADALFYTAHDGTAATSLGDLQLVKPCVDMATTRRDKQLLSARSITANDAGDPGSEGSLRKLAGGADPAVLLSVTHGLGAPRAGWKTEELQRRRQGALSLGGDVLDAEAIASGPFLPGGFWYCLACFGAGTPPASAFYPWLQQLAAQRAYSGRLDAVLASLPQEGARAFIAALPQAALANPEGPLGIISHVDLAWTHSFTDPTDPSKSRASRIYETLKLIVNGSRIGVGLDNLLEGYRIANDHLNIIAGAAEESRAFNKPDTTDRKELANVWMQRNDLRGYILLGDPAARLPITANVVAEPVVKAAPEIGVTAAVTTAQAVPPPNVDAKEDAVHALLAGDEAPKSIASRFGLASVGELFRLFDAYRTAGRSGLG